MSIAEVAIEPRRSLRRSAQEQKQTSAESVSIKPINGKKRSLDEDDAPILDSSVSVKDEDPDDESSSSEDSSGPPPLKKVARTSAASGAIQWKTATGAPKQLAFKKVGDSSANGSNAKFKASFSSSSSTAAPLNLATALAGILPQPSLPLITTNAKILLPNPQAFTPRFPSISTPSTSHIVRRRNDKVNNEVCDDCVKVLPNLRRSLGRLETRMEAVTSMIKQIVNKHSLQNVAFARPAIINKMGQSSSPSSSANGNRVQGKPTAMRFVPIGSKNTTSPGMRQFVSEKGVRLTPDKLMYRMISRGLLTYRSGSLTIEEYYKQAPKVIKAHSLLQVQHVMEDLVASQLFKKSDISVDLMDRECIFEKERDLSKLARLSDYDVNLADFLNGCFDD